MDWDPELDVTLSNGRRVLTFQIAAVEGAREAWAILEPGTQFEDRRTQFDLRLTKIFKLGSRWRVQANADAYNIFNLSPILSRTNTFGSSWGRPSSILAPRLIQFSGKVSF